MKKLIFSAIVLVMIACSMVACSNQDANIPADTVLAPEVTTAPAAPELPELSDDFIETALQFIDEYSTPSKELENLAAEAIQQSNGFRDSLYDYLNYYLIKEYGEEIRQFFGDHQSVIVADVWVHNYQIGGSMDCVSYNGQDPVLNNRDPIILSAGVLGDTYPNNITLAEARISAYVLIHMDTSGIDCCISKNAEGMEFYDFTFANKAFKEAAKEILQSLLES